MTANTEVGRYEVTVNLMPRAYKALNTASEAAGLSRTDVLNRAVQIAAVVERALADGGAVFVRESAGSGVRELLIETDEVIS